MSSNVQAKNLEKFKVPDYELSGIVAESLAHKILLAKECDSENLVVLKISQSPFPSKLELAALQQEHKISSLLQGVSGVLSSKKVVNYGQQNIALVIDFFGESLSEFLQKNRKIASIGQFLQIAQFITKALSEIHNRNIIHKNICPENILIDPKSLEIKIIDFGISTSLVNEFQNTPSGQLEGSLPYISPEQTGRMNRTLDYRTDFYSLGITFYEMLTGRLPFNVESPLEWSHCHISQIPPAINHIREDIPKPLINIIHKMIAKEASERYQSSFTLLNDIKFCADHLDQKQSLESYKIGQNDISQKFQIPKLLFGREEEFKALYDVYSEVKYSQTKFCLVSGYSGVGKSSLVNELWKVVTSRRGFLIQGKYDQLQQNQSYSAIQVAFSELITQILSESTEKIHQWKDELLAELDNFGQLIINIVPELEYIIGKQTPVPELPPTEAQIRLQMVFVKFLKVFSKHDYSLVIFLDDLQWADIPSLNLIESILNSNELRHILLIGAYRNNEVNNTHPLNILVDSISNQMEIVKIHLDPLDEIGLGMFIASTLYKNIDDIKDLRQAVFSKTKGNPFFAGELLKKLHKENIVYFNPSNGQWDWLIEKVQKVDVAENVVDFLIEKLHQLPEDTQTLLHKASCIGNRFDLQTIAIITEDSIANLSKILQVSLENSLIYALSEDYKVAEFQQDKNFNVEYRFQHDHVQQAAYELLPDEKRCFTHLVIGRLLEKKLYIDHNSDKLSDVTHHLNLGRSLISNSTQLDELAHLNFQVGCNAKKSSAYRVAIEFFEIAIEIIGDNAWENNYDFMMNIASEYQQCFYLISNYHQADKWAEKILNKSKSDIESARFMSTRTRQFSTMGKMLDSIDIAVKGLSILGYEIDQNPSESKIAQEIEDVTVNMQNREIHDLINAPTVSNENSELAIRILMEIFPAAFLSGSGNLFPYLVLKMVNLSLKDGNSPEGAFAFAAYGMILCGYLKDPEKGYEFGKLAIALNEKFNNIELKARTIYVYTMFIHHWSNHWSSMTYWFRKGIEAGYQSGDLLYLAYSAQDCIIWDPKLDLESASMQQKKYLDIIRDCKYQDSFDSGSLFLQMQLNFRGLTDSLFSLNIKGHESFFDFDEEKSIDGMHHRKFMTGIANYQIYKSEIHFLYEDFPIAFEFVKKQEKMIASSMSLPQIVRFYFIAFLTRSAVHSWLQEDEQKENFELLQIYRRQMFDWEKNCEDNFKHLRMCMDAEFLSLNGETFSALNLFNEAILNAEKFEYRRDLAMINELAARALINSGHEKAAYGYIQSSHHIYGLWGANRKVEQMEGRYPILRNSSYMGKTKSNTLSIESSSLDMESILKASREISGEIILDKLWETTLSLLMENAGGQRACYVVLENNQLSIQADINISRPNFNSMYNVEQKLDEKIPVSLIFNVLRTGKPVVINSLNSSHAFDKDLYFKNLQSGSAFCIPLKHRGNLKSVIYIENILVSDAFTEKRVEVIKLLSAQASTSQENAKLFQEQMKLTNAQQRFVPKEFLQILGHFDISRVSLGEFVSKKMSVMFSDLRGFTNLSEKVDPKEMIIILNRYFSHVSVPIYELGGFIDSFNGDEVMVLFDSQTTDDAIKAGIGMRKALNELNKDSFFDKYPKLDMGIGINSGDLVLGTIGMEDRLKCGVAGDVVNTASRIEQLTKKYNAPFLIGESTYASIENPSQFHIRLVDWIAVKGKNNAIKIYEIIDGENSDSFARKCATKEILEKAMGEYFSRNFKDAIALFDKAQVIDSQDVVISIFKQRCQNFIVNPPSEDWQGFEILHSK